MKNLTTLLSCFALISCAFAQNVTLVHESTSGGCDGAAYLDTGSINTQYGYNWWESDSTNTPVSMIGSAPTDSLTGLCPGNYILHYYQNQGMDTLEYTFTINPAPGNGLSATLYLSDESSSGSCDGSVAVSASGGAPPYYFEHSTGTNGAVDSALCSGLYDVMVYDAQDTIILPYVIASPNYIYNDTTYSDSTITDTLASAPLENCSLDYGTIDSVYVVNVQNLPGDSIEVTWAVTDMSGTSQLSNTYYLQGNYMGVYAFELNLYCTIKQTGANVYKASVNYYLDNNSLQVSTIDQSFIPLIFPNPAQNSVTLAASAEMTGSSYEIYDMKGAQVHTGSVSNQETVIDIQMLDRGTYFIHINGTTPIKFVKN
ncbi:MAG: T9SS type A sorting domain-containing protein [Bacteroidota bacterium]